MLRTQYHLKMTYNQTGPLKRKEKYLNIDTSTPA